MLTPDTTRETFLREYERWVQGQVVHFPFLPQIDGDIRPLMRSAGKRLRVGRSLPISEIAPLLAVCYFATQEFDYPAWQRWVISWAVWCSRKLLRERPMWNDFQMVLWQLSRDPARVWEMYEYFRNPRRSLMQMNTGAWMVESVCQQDAEFSSLWKEHVSSFGNPFGGPISVARELLPRSVHVHLVAIIERGVRGAKC